jgi:hypothetical protein
MRHLVPDLRNQQQHIARPDVDDTVQDALSAAARPRHAALSAYAAVATVEGGDSTMMQSANMALTKSLGLAGTSKEGLCLSE